MNIDDLEAIAVQIKSIMAGPPSRRRRFRALEIMCGRCGSLLGEVYATTPRPAVTFRATAAWGGWHQRIHGLHDPARPVSIRMACRCRQVEVSEADIVAKLEAGAARMRVA